MIAKATAGATRTAGTRTRASGSRRRSSRAPTARGARVGQAKDVSHERWVGGLGRTQQRRQRPHHPSAIEPPRLLVPRRGGPGFPRDRPPAGAKRHTQATYARGGGIHRRLLQQGEETVTGPGDLHGTQVRVEAPPRQTGTGYLHAGEGASRPPSVTGGGRRPRKRTRGVELGAEHFAAGGTRTATNFKQGVAD